MMCAYRLVSIKFNIFGIQNKFERMLDSMEQNFYLQFHKQIFTLIDEWYGLSIEDIREKENHLKKEFDEVRILKIFFKLKLADKIIINITSSSA